MIVKPKIIYYMVAILCLVAVSLPFQSAFLYKHSLSEINEIFAKVTILNWIMAASIILTAGAIYKLSPFVKYLAPVTLILVCWNNYVVGTMNTDFPLEQTLIASAFFTLLFAPLLRKDIRKILGNPQMRWWDRSPRFNKQLAVTMYPYVGNTQSSHTFDISETGAFIVISDKHLETLPQVGERIKISFTLSTLKKIKCDAVVVRIEEAKGIYPKGLGIRFTSFPKDQRKILSQFLTH